MVQKHFQFDGPAPRPKLLFAVLVDQRLAVRVEHWATDPDAFSRICRILRDNQF